MLIIKLKVNFFFKFYSLKAIIYTFTIKINIHFKNFNGLTLFQDYCLE